MAKSSKIAIFEGRKIRRHWDEEKEMLNHLSYGLPELDMMSPCHSHANGNPEIICIDSRSESGMTNSSGIQNSYAQNILRLHISK